MVGLSAKENRMGKLAGKIALVTGGNSGIGFGNGKAVLQGGRTRFRDRAPPTRASGGGQSEGRVQHQRRGITAHHPRSAAGHGQTRGRG